MASIEIGSNSTFKAGTAEGRLIEVICFLQLQEADPTRNTVSRDVIQGDFSIQESLFSGAYNLPAQQTISGSGTLQIAAVTYLQGVAIQPGAGSPTFKSTTLEGYLLEVLMWVQGAERVATRNPTGRNAITGSFNSDTSVYTGTFALPVELTLGATGAPVFTAVEYLSN